MAAAPGMTSLLSSSEGMIRSGSWRPSCQVGHVHCSHSTCSSQERSGPGHGETESQEQFVLVMHSAGSDPVLTV